MEGERGKEVEVDEDLEVGPVGEGKCQEGGDRYAWPPQQALHKKVEVSALLTETRRQVETLTVDCALQRLKGG